MFRNIFKIFLFTALLGFIYHLSSLFIRIGFQVSMDKSIFIHIIPLIISFVFMIICHKIIYRNMKTYDEEVHKINKIR